MRIMVFRTPQERAMGLQRRPFIENDMLFVFPEIEGGDWFHSRNVPEAFDIAFADDTGRVIQVWKITPPDQMIKCPEGTKMVYEAKAGNMPRWGILAGNKFQVPLGV